MKKRKRMRLEEPHPSHNWILNSSEGLRPLSDALLQVHDEGTTYRVEKELLDELRFHALIEGHGRDVKVTPLGQRAVDDRKGLQKPEGKTKPVPVTRKKRVRL